MILLNFYLIFYWFKFDRTYVYIVYCKQYWVNFNWPRAKYGKNPFSLRDNWIKVQKNFCTTNMLCGSSLYDRLFVARILFWSIYINWMMGKLNLIIPNTINRWAGGNIYKRSMCSIVYTAIRICCCWHRASHHLLDRRTSLRMPSYIAYNTRIIPTYLLIFKVICADQRW